MYLNSIQGLHQAIKETPHYKNKRPSEKPVLIDKVNFLMDSIYSGNRQHWNLKDFEPVPIHHKTLRKMLGRYEADIIIDILKDLELL